MTNIDRNNLIAERIQFWQNCINSVQSDIDILRSGGTLNEDNGDKIIDIESRIAHGIEYIELCNRMIFNLTKAID